MGKKKRKSVPSDSSKRTPLKEELSEDFPAWLELRLLGSRKGKASDAPAILLSKEDAYRLDLLNEDQILVMVLQNASIVQTAVCSARIVAPSQEIMAAGSPSMRSPSSSNSRLSQGSCQIVPPILLERLCAPERKVEEEDNKSSVAVSLASSTSEGFSFARGGGGDALIASPKAHSKKETPNLSSKIVWIVPLYTTLGSKLIASLMRPCVGLSLKPALDIPVNALKVARKLVASRFADHYLIDGETITILFQGKPLSLTVSKVNSHTTHVDALEQALDHLTLDEEEAENDSLLKIIDAVEEALEDPVKMSSLQLFHVTPDTEITIESGTDGNEADSVLKGPFVAGVDDIIQQLKDILLPTLLDAEAYEDLKPPRGALLFGPGGVGKTALSLQIAEDLRQSYPQQMDVDFVHCASLQSHTSVVGEGERMLSKLFKRTKKTLLILDDIHFICPKRGNNPGVDRLAATLLALLDGVETNANVYLLATTANPSLLDPALRRPGRLDDEVEIPIPDSTCRTKIMRFHLDALRAQGIVAVDDFTDDQLSEFAILAKGFNGADCLLAVKEATRKAAITGNRPPHVTQEVLKTAIGITKPSTISSITVEVPKVYWSSIGGMEDVKEKLREAIEMPLTHADLFAKLKIPPPRGVLLYGPPGCSKTLMARALATEGKMNFLAVKGPELLSKWLGESERALASLFKRARMASPCIIFFDEVDSIASKRGSGGDSGGGERLLSQMLTELDGIGTRGKSHVVVVAATNRPDLLDHALTRPGRIDRKIYVGVPDQDSRAQIFEIGLKNKAHADDIDYKELAADEISGGFSGAELIAICRDAALLAIEEASEDMVDSDELMIQRRHLIKAINSTPQQVTPAMLDYFETYAKSVRRA